MRVEGNQEQRKEQGRGIGCSRVVGKGRGIGCSRVGGKGRGSRHLRCLQDLTQLAFPKKLSGSRPFTPFVRRSTARPRQPGAGRGVPVLLPLAAGCWPGRGRPRRWQISVHTAPHRASLVLMSAQPAAAAACHVQRNTVGR